MDYYLETSPPQIRLDRITSIGPNSSPIKVIVEDLQSGLKYATISIVEEDSSQEALKTKKSEIYSFTPSKKIEKLMQYELDVKSVLKKISQNKAAILVEAGNNSVWKGQSSQSMPIQIDTEAPVLANITTKKLSPLENFFLITAEIKDPFFKIASIKGPGFSAQLINNYDYRNGSTTRNAERQETGEYFGFFAGQAQELVLEASDEANNQTTHKFTIKLDKIPDQSKTFRLDKRDYEKFLQRFLVDGYECTKEIDSILKDVASATSLIEVANECMTELEKELRARLSSLKSTSTWPVPFYRQASKLISPFGQSIDIVNGAEVFTIPPYYELLQLTASDRVLAIAPGQISFIRHLSPNDHLVAIDHGFGLTSIYMGINSSLTEGNFVKPGDLLGFAGRISRTDPFSFFLGMRYFGQPIPIKPFFKDTIERAIR